MKPPRTIGVARTVDPTQTDFIPRSIRYFLEQVSKVTANISYGITTSNNDLSQNVQCWKATGTAPAMPNTAFTVQHNLSHVPFGFNIVRTDRAAHIFDSGTAWAAATSTSLGTISLMSDTASVVFTLIIY